MIVTQLQVSPQSCSARAEIEPGLCLTPVKEKRIITAAIHLHLLHVTVLPLANPASSRISQAQLVDLVLFSQIMAQLKETSPLCNSCNSTTVVTFTAGVIGIFCNIHRRRRCLFVSGTFLAPAVNVTKLISFHGALP